VQNAIKHLHEEKDEDKNEKKRKEKNTRKRKEKNEEENREDNEDTSILSDFSACMFEYDDPIEFEQKFQIMRKKVSSQTWLDSIYKLKEKMG